MVYKTPLLAIRWNGIFGSGPTLKAEEWSFGVHVETELEPAQLGEAYLAQDAGLWGCGTEYIANQQLGSSFSNEVWLLEVAAAFVNPNGTLVGGSYVRHQGAATGGYAAPGGMPLDTSFCVTLDCGPPVRGRFGRFYPPLQPGSLTVGHAAESDQFLRLAAVQRFLTRVVDAAGTKPGQPDNVKATLVVASKTYVINRPVTELRIGNVPDVQRRRRRSLPEEYSIRPMIN